MTVSLQSGIEIFLHPGEWYFGDEHTRIRTTLGSCVAVTLWHPRFRVGGMCHFMLPGSDDGQDPLNARYGSDAMVLLVGEAKRHGATAVEYQAKLFGGASMFELGPGGGSVAARNIEAAEKLVQRHGLTVVARSLGGTRYRQLVFNLADGDVWVRQGSDRDQACSNLGGVA